MKTIIRLTLAAAFAVSAVPALAEGQARSENTLYGGAMRPETVRSEKPSAIVTAGSASDAPAEGAKAPAAHEASEEQALPDDPFNRSMDAP